MEATTTATKQIPISPNTKFEDTLKVFDAQFKNKWNLRNTTASDRKKKLKKLREVIFANGTKIEEVIYADFRKPAIEVQYSEIAPVIIQINHALRNLDDWMADKEVDTPLIFLGTASKVVFEPKGNTLILTPWN